ncbi:MAG: hypothetical protein ACTSUS_00995 [Candidatus Freyarchaeota archaeon]
MNEEKLGLEKLLQRIDQLLDVLNVIVEDLKDISKTLRASGVSAAVTKPTERTIQGVRALFPEDLEKLLTFEEEGNYIVIKPRRYLGSENFSKIASIVRSEGGEYISAGRESHFRIPKETT